MNNEKNKLNFIIPFAKPSGVTSFRSMNVVKKIIGTKKVGHTGTLDLFADGLLVLLSGQYTRFAELISAGKKEYRAWVEFGKQTETLDPEGELCLEKPLPSFEALEKAVNSFLGKQEQTPPKFSAIKIKGKRASDRIRAGEEIEMKSREIEIFSIKVEQVIKNEEDENTEEDKIQFAEISVACSKGTYIRSLARDIAEKAGSCAYLRALRRTAVGNFRLEEAVGYSALDDFSSLGEEFILEIKEKAKTECRTKNSTEKQDLEKTSEELHKKSIIFTKELAKELDLESVNLDKKYLFDFQHGKPIRKNWFTLLDDNCELKENKPIPVFCENNCVGLLTKNSENKLKYQLVFS